MTARDASRWLLLVCVLVAVGTVTAGCGCGKRRGSQGSVSQLRQTRLRFAADERKAMCYIVAEVENTGKVPVREATVTATLKSKSGKTRGLNNQPLKDIRPGEKRLLHMTVRSHGSFHRVELSFSEPGRRG